MALILRSSPYYWTAGDVVQERATAIQLEAPPVITLSQRGSLSEGSFRVLTDRRSALDFTAGTIVRVPVVTTTPHGGAVQTTVEGLVEDNSTVLSDNEEVVGGLYPGSPPPLAELIDRFPQPEPSSEFLEEPIFTEAPPSESGGGGGISEEAPDAPTGSISTEEFAGDIQDIGSLIGDIFGRFFGGDV